MTDPVATRRSFIGSAAALAPLGMLAACGGSGSGSGGSLFGATAIDMRPEPDIWTSAVGQVFNVAAPSGRISATLSSVAPQSPGGDRPEELRQTPIMLTFTLFPGYDTIGDEVYWLDRTMGTESRLFMQRATDANGRITLMALLN
jgi:hypothetical protein